MTALLTPSRPRTQSPIPPGDWGGPGRELRQSQSRRRLGRLGRSRWTRLGLPALAVLCALVAGAALLFPTLSGLYTRHEQQILAGELDTPAVGAVAGASGDAVARVTIPAIALDMVVVQGTDASALAKGPGHYPASPMPCTEGNVAIAGHRTTFLHPFHDLNRLVPGDVIELRTRSLSCAYSVTTAPFAVSPRDSAVVADTPGRFGLTLTTCHPIGSSAERLIVQASLVPGSLRTVNPHRA